MRGMRRWVILLILGGFGAGFAAAPVIAPAATEGPTADAPTFAAGDQWRWEGGQYPVVTRVVALQGDGSVVVESNRWCKDGCPYTRDPTAVSGIVSFVRIDFPLRVGKAWTHEERESSVAGTSFTYVNRWKVEAVEQVRVKAGTFRAFRIAYEQENRETRWKGTATFWWSPDTKSLVKRVSHRGWSPDSQIARDIQLVSYSLAAPKPPAVALPVPASPAPSPPPAAEPRSTASPVPAAAPPPAPPPSPPASPSTASARPAPATPPPGTVARAATLEREARQFLRDRRFVEAAARAREAVAIREEILGPKHLDTAESQTTLGELYAAQGQWADAERLHRRALATREELLSRDHPLVAQSLNQLAMLHNAQATYLDAEKLLRRAYAILEGVQATMLRNHVLQAEVLENLARVYRALGKAAEAEEAEAKAAVLSTLR